MYENMKEKIYKAMCSSHDLVSSTDNEILDLIANELQTDEFLQEMADQESLARLRILNRLAANTNDPDIKNMIAAQNGMREYLIKKVHHQAIHIYKNCLLNRFFEQIYRYRLQAEQCGDLTVQMEYTCEADGLMAAAVLITHAELDDVLDLYDMYVERYKSN